MQQCPLEGRDLADGPFP